MTNLSEHAGGGDIYTPAIKEFDGSQYISESFTSAGNKITIAVRFKIPTFLTATEVASGVIRIETGGKHRAALFVYPSDNATRANKGLLVVNDSAGANKFRITSAIDVCGSGKIHTVFLSFDGDAGTAVYLLDGDAANWDTGHVDYIAPAITTLPTGAGTAYVGANAAGSLFLTGAVGYAHHAESIEDPTIFFNEDGLPKEVVGSGFKHSNPHGDWRDNDGTEGNGTLSGGGYLPISDAGNLGHPHLGLATVGDAVAAEIAAAKTAWVDGVEIVGSGYVPHPTISNVELWLDATDPPNWMASAGGTLTRWSDRSGNNNDSINATGTPQLVVNAHGSLYGVNLDATTEQFQFPPAFLDKTFTVICVIKGSPSVGAGPYMFTGHDGTASAGRWYITVGGTFSYHDGTSYVAVASGTSIIANTLSVMAWRMDGSVFQGAYNDQPFTGSDDISSAANPLNTNLRIGGIGTGTDAATGAYILELIVLTNSISDADWSLLQAYFDAKY